MAKTKFRLGEWELLILLWFAFFLNQADRQIFNVTLPLIRSDIDLTDGEFGLIAASLVWTYGFLVPVAGFLGDIFPRRNILAFCILFWSISTFFTGFASGLIPFILLLGIATGGGESFYAPSANAMLGERYKDNRAFALSIHQTAVYAGIILSGVLAGYIGQHYGWRNSFKIFGLAGIVLSLIFMWRVKANHEVKFLNKKPIGQSIKEGMKVLGKPTAISLIVAFSCMVFVNVGYLTWMPLFLVEKFGLSVTEAGFSSLAYHHAGAFVGVMIGSRFADRMAKVDPRKRLIIQSVALVLGAPFIFMMGFAESQLVTYISLALFGVMRGVYDSNHFASMYEIVKPELRSTATGFMLMFAFLTGAFAPLILGILKPTLGLAWGFSSLSIFYLIGSISIFLGARNWFKNDYIGDKILV